MPLINAKHEFLAQELASGKSVREAAKVAKMSYQWALTLSKKPIIKNRKDTIMRMALSSKVADNNELMESLTRMLRGLDPTDTVITGGKVAEFYHFLQANHELATRIPGAIVQIQPPTGNTSNTQINVFVLSDKAKELSERVTERLIDGNRNGS